MIQKRDVFISAVLEVIQLERQLKTVTHAREKLYTNRQCDKLNYPKGYLKRIR